MPSRMKAIRTLVETHLATAFSGVTIGNEPTTMDVIPKQDFPYATVLVEEEEPERLDFKQERRRVVGSILLVIHTTPGDTAEAAREAMDIKLEAVRDAIFGDPYLADSVDGASVTRAATISGPDDVYVYGEIDFQTEEIMTNSQSISSGDFNVRDYGTVGNGVADDTAAIQAAVAAADAAGGGIVFFPAGNYLVTDTITITAIVQLWGAGHGSILQSSTANPIVDFAADQAVGSPFTSRGSAVRHMKIDGLDVANALVGIRMVKWDDSDPGIEHARNAGIEDLIITRCGVGCRQIYTQGVYLDSISFEANTTGLYCSDNAQLGHVTQCDFRANVTGVRMEATHDVIGEEEAQDSTYEWQFDKCHFEINTGVGLVLDGTHSCTFNTCKWEQNEGGSIVITNAVSGTRSDNTVFINCMWNGCPAVPTAKHIDFVNCSNTMFIGGTWAVNNTGGLNIQINAHKTSFIFPNLNRSIVTEASHSVYFVDGISALTKLPFAPSILYGWLAHDNQTIYLSTGLPHASTGDARLPRHIILDDMKIYVTEAFDSDGTDLLRLGVLGSRNLYCANTDVSTTGIKTPTRSGGSTNGYMDLAVVAGADYQVYAEYVAGGSAPSVGKALCVFKYSEAPDDPA